ncbi:MAG: tetratricopeptide repeat protein, partial [Anaerolineales bacterium]
MSLTFYIPQDRLSALAHGESFPDRTNGSALFADISGFTALTESLRKSLGARQGAEALTKQLGAVYTVLIAEVEKYGGSVIGFAGDAMMCWFNAKGEENNASSRAIASAFGMQSAIQAFPTLGLKVTIATGETRRFVVGDPEIQRLDTLAGATVARTSMAEHYAEKGDVLVDEVTAKSLGDSLTIKAWREDKESKERFAVVSNYTGSTVEEKPDTHSALGNEVLQSWISREVFEREISTQGAFLTEFRPCVALFVRFIGIDYDTDEAEEQLDVFIRSVQTIVERYEGVFLQFTIGDKGSYAYISFGALITHEDDARRAVKTAIELRELAEQLGFLQPLQIGITQGVLRVGAYGGQTRKTFGALGDDVNLAARLMTTASAGEILLSGFAYKAVQNDFTFEPRPPLAMKGKAEPLPVFAVTGERQQRAIRLQEPNYALPMVGRESELRSIEEKLDLAAKTKGQVVGIVAEAGMGKSRLVAEVIRSARKKGFVGYGGACQADGIHTPYLTWKSIWQAFFDVDPEMPMRRLIRWLEGEIEDRAPSRVEVLPLLGTLLDLNIPDNDFTKSLEPEIRKSTLHALLEDCLKTAARDEPILIVIEDLHWIDALSHDLLEGLAKALADQAVCFVLAYRPLDLERVKALQLENLSQFTRIKLHELSRDEAEQAIRAKLAQLYPARSGAVSDELVDQLMMRAQGNPFYLEELLNFLRDRGLDPRDPADLKKIKLPDSLHTLILSRIDQLSEQEKTTLRVASIIGRLFRAKWLTGYYPELGTPPQVKVALDALDKLDITPLDSHAQSPQGEPELVYLFKHIVTHEVTYESLPFATRTRLHEQLAKYLEDQILGMTHVSPLLDTIAYHYLHSENKEKQREYLRRAGEAAQKNFANDAALDYYGKLIPLLEDQKERIEIRMQRGMVLELMGQYEEAETDYHALLEMARDDIEISADAQFALGKLKRLRNDFDAALEWLTQAQGGYTTSSNQIGLARALIEKGWVFYRKGEYGQAHEPLSEGLRLAREAKSKPEIALALNNLGALTLYQRDFVIARTLYEESLALRREIKDKPGIASSLFSLAILATNEGNMTMPRSLYEESLMLRREIGDKRGIAASLTNLGAVAIYQSDYSMARTVSEESLMLRREMGDKKGIAGSLHSLGMIAARQGDYESGQRLLEESLVLERELGDRRGLAYLLNSMGQVVLA